MMISWSRNLDSCSSSAQTDVNGCPRPKSTIRAELLSTLPAICLSHEGNNATGVRQPGILIHQWQLWQQKQQGPQRRSRSGDGSTAPAGRSEGAHCSSPGPGTSWAQGPRPAAAGNCADSRRPRLATLLDQPSRRRGRDRSGAPGSGAPGRIRTCEKTD